MWAGTSGSPIADEVLGPSTAFANEYEAAVVEQSIFRGLLPHPSIADYHLAAFDALEAIAADGRPTLTLAHIILPHPPYGPATATAGSCRTSRSSAASGAGPRTSAATSSRSDW